jgi:hypothetical protein
MAAILIDLRCSKQQQDRNHEALEHNRHPMERDRQPGRSRFKSFRHSLSLVATYLQWR